ncbi:hypothetical protein OTK49_21500 [Vibrio coralliirubri]|uniref:hypothetical protein n=1 Tax=Vibrio coralliirubri TaxID=1516159 RepID=UPI002284C639|nr:hypothetical protein [Vibrio coralliirubri]MCY9865098.1 hypothetical protein [Vibrio coralliirubri]
MKALKGWVFMPLVYIAFLAPLIQFVVSYTLGISHGVELKYAAISTLVPWSLSAVVSAVVFVVYLGRVSKEEVELMLSYSVVTLVMLILCSMKMEQAEGLYSVSGWQKFDYAPVDRMLLVPYDDKEFSFPSLRKFENGGYIMEKSTDTGMFSKYYACPVQVDSDSCIEIGEH